MAWETKKLGDVCEILDTLRKPITKKDRINGSYPYYGATGVVDWVADYIFDERLVLVGEDGAKWSSGDKTAFIVKGKIWVNNHAHVLRPHPNIVMHEWLTYHLVHLDLKKWVTGLTVPKLNQANLRSIPIPIPPLPEQKRIVAKLDKAFAEIEDILKITKKEEKIVIEALQASLMKKLFIPDEKINSDWEDLELTNVCTLLNGRAYKKPELLQEGKYPVLRVGNFFTNTNWYYSNLELEDNKYCDNGDLLYAWSASFGPRLWEGEKVIYHYHIWRIDINEKLVDKRFLFYWFDFDKELIKSASGTGTTMMHVSKSSMEKRRINLPPLPEQKLIAEQLDKVFTEVKLLHNVLQKKIEQISFLKSAILKKELQSEAA